MTNMMRKENGQLMIESIVGISLVMVGLLGVMTLLIRSSQWNRDVGLKLQATYLAAEGIEVIKNMIDTNIAKMLSEGGVAWNARLTSPSKEYEVTSEGVVRNFTASRPLEFHATRGYGYDYGTDGVKSPFTRKVSISESTDKITVRAEVSWGLGKKVILEDIFTFWRKQGAR